MTPTELALSRRQLKRRLHRWQIAAIVALVCLALVAFGRFGPQFSGSYIAEIPIDGIIFSDDGLTDLIDSVNSDERAVAAIVRIESPGGGTFASEAIYQKLRALSETKPTVAVMGSVAASGGYMAALGCDYVLAQPTTITGSIGVIMEAVNFVDLLDSLGIQATAFKSGPLKAQPNPFEPLTPEAREATQALIDEIHSLFVDMVVQGRSLDRESVLELADGRVFSGSRAAELGLIDGLGGMEQALNWLSETHGIDDSLPQQKFELDQDEGFLTVMLSLITGKSYLPERLRLDGLMSVWHASQIMNR